ncbi:MAG: hypothetical protein M3Z08_05080, partial [Chloroflexota bacterium]|nr:hypothetical protein [Chloroflexota bacterium]
MYRRSLNAHTGESTAATLYRRARAGRGKAFTAASILAMLCLLGILLASCTGNTQPASGTAHPQQHIANNTISYSISAQDVLIRTFRGGGHMGTLDLSPQISIYGDGTYILGPGLDMRQGKVDTNELQQLLSILVNTDGLLNLKRQQFYDIADQDATLLQISLNERNYQFLYGKFGSRQESQQVMDEYHHLEQALSTITASLNGPTQPYTNPTQALLAYQNFSPNLSQSIPTWDFPDFTLGQLATYECGPVPQDITGPNADSGCLEFNIPRNALLLTNGQARKITEMLHGHLSREFYEPGSGLYYI